MNSRYTRPSTWANLDFLILSQHPVLLNILLRVWNFCCILPIIFQIKCRKDKYTLNDETTFRIDSYIFRFSDTVQPLNLCKPKIFLLFFEKWLIFLGSFVFCFCIFQKQENFDLYLESLANRYMSHETL